MSIVARMIFSAHATVCGGDWSRILLIMAKGANRVVIAGSRASTIGQGHGVDRGRLL
jgi:hypothetical protein